MLFIDYSKPKIILTCGLPGSAKSTWAKNQLKLFPNKIKLVCKDDLRLMLDAGESSKGNEIFLLGIRDQIIQDAIKTGKSVIVADTNLSAKHERHIDTLSHGRADLEMVFFDVSVETCIKRDGERTPRVGKKVIRSMENLFNDQKKSLSSKSFKVHVITEQDQEMEFSSSVVANTEEKYIQDIELPHCIIFDIDGTVALMNGKRGPYDWHKVSMDDVNEPVAGIVKMEYESEVPVFAVSGRDGSCRDLTENWLTANGIPFDGLFMRPAGDSRKDTIIKKEIFEREFKGKYYIKYILDDRDSVVKQYRDIGLTCIQVAPGSF